MAHGNSRLGELAEVVGGEVMAAQGGSDVEVDDVTHDSRQAGPGALFVAVRGAIADGHDYVAAAIDAGSPAVCLEHPMGSAVPELIVPDTRTAMGLLASAVHHEPSRSLKVIGVTGTNGKTTVTHYIDSIASSAGRRSGLIGTIETRIGTETLVSVRTTPEATDFQRLLAEMRDRDTEIVAVEVSSHALELKRVNGTRFEIAAFTNLSQDHLDFHGDMASYLRAKTRLFEEYEVGTAVVNIDDPAGRGIASAHTGDLIRVGSDGDVSFDNLSPRRDGTVFDLITPWGSAQVATSARGDFNVQNAVIAATCCLISGVTFEEAVGGLETLAGVPGRFEVVSEDGVTVIVDYAHTPEAIAEAIGAARGLDRGRVIVLIGAGGDRDRQKRPLMGSAVSSADVVVVTSDNPRSEDPASIIDAIVSGVEPGTVLMVEVDRRKAIGAAIDAAVEDDVVLILGRGHETHQEIAGQRQPFDDRAVAREAAIRRRKSTNSGANSGSMGP